MLTAEALEQVVPIFYCSGRSGSVFLHSLLDNHPDVIAMPPVLAGYYEFLTECSKIPHCDVISLFCDYYEVLFQVDSEKLIIGSGRAPGIQLGLDKMGEEGDQKLQVDRKVFEVALREIFEGRSEVDSRFFFQAIHLAYARALGRHFEDRDRAPIIVYQLHNPILQRFRRLLADFPQAQALSTIRNPIQSFGSHATAHVKQGTTNAQTLKYLLQESFYGGEPLLEPQRKHSRAVRLEDLKLKTRPTLQALCDWLQIPWDDALLDSTISGLTWWNVKDSSRIRGFDTTPLKRKHENLFNTFDRFRLEVILGDKYAQWGYEPLAEWSDYSLMRQLLELPFKFERFYAADEGMFQQNRPIVRRFMQTYWDYVHLSEEPRRLLEVLEPADASVGE
ncbi:MAG: sulfotransferase [Planctomycetota bacterium]|jgi:hypothetical protein|nr:sulfotransferase [Planctomycetota bacterium]